MAGGMDRRVGGAPLAQRRRGPVPPHLHTCPARHCWVADAADGHGVKRPGLLLEWRQTRSGWEGLVVYAAHVRPEVWGLVQEWVPAALLTPL